MTLTRRTFLTLAGATGLAWAAPIHARQIVRLEGMAFGSFFRLTLPEGGAKEEAERSVLEMVGMVDRLMSPYRPESELSRFNTSPTTDAVPLSAPVREVLETGLAISRASGGAFDPTVGPVVGRYGFGPIAGGRSGHFSQLHLGQDGLRKEVADLSIDLCGIAKGYALDLIADALDGQGFGHYLLEVGGEVVARGRHPDGRAWQVGIERPGVASGFAHLVGLEDRAVATSGDAANFYEIGGRRYTHIVDPGSGAPVTGSIASVSVLAGRGLEADGWATALMAAGSERGPALAEAEGLDALFFLRDGDGLKTVATGRFDSHLLA